MAGAPSRFAILIGVDRHHESLTALRSGAEDCRRLRDSLLADLSARFVGIRPEGLDGEIENVLARVGEALERDREPGSSVVEVVATFDDARKAAPQSLNPRLLQKAYR